MSDLDVQPPVPPGAEPALRATVAAMREVVGEAVAGLELPSPAYALCLWLGDDDEDLAPMSVSLGLDDDRRRRPDLVWSHADYAVDELDVPESAALETAAAELVPRLREAGVPVPSLWALREAARALTQEPPPVPVTDDFVAFAVASYTTAREGVEHSLTPALRELLAARGLLEPGA